MSTFIIKTLLEDVYDELVYDNSPSFKDFRPKGVWFILYDKKNIAGLINLEPLNNVMWTCHVVIFKEFRKNKSERWGTQVADYMRKTYGTKKFLAFTPYESAKKYAERMGFKHTATLNKSIKKNGELLDQYLMEME